MYYTRAGMGGTSLSNCEYSHCTRKVVISINKRSVLEQMILDAERRPDYSGLFYGSPRKFMEIPGQSVSSGSSYTYLYNLGLTRKGRGPNAVWYIPAGVMRQYLDAYLFLSRFAYPLKIHYPIKQIEICV